ncbi:hypothetical protein KORDIASMS9_04275 [Kordia sp. SMS9]|uniref:hypothetical protein n=1 Tax=Kordia sp. SMS9 TaxID=2282170 RepID=UPI000E0DF345|nr:hypothetical protein [Kordia sp. SMS9]AXG72013.1 hypothetical protein KORDIASMS9_04275 [Kordia sp. SMS9]
MKKAQKVRLVLNKKNISSFRLNQIVGGGETYPCPHTIGQVCTSTLPGTILGCNDGPSEFGAGGCTFEQEK